MIPATRCISVPLDHRSVSLQIPADPDQMLEDALAGEACGNRNTDPYWGLLWDAAPRTARLILSRKWTAKAKALELGCGVGLAGIAGLMAGMDVTFSDLVPSAVQMAQENAALNGFPDAAGLVVDWLCPPPVSFDVLLASDVLYDSANHAPLLQTIEAMLNTDGCVWIGDAGRANAPKFIDQAQKSGWHVQIFDEELHRLSQPTHIRFQLLVLSRTSGG